MRGFVGIVRSGRQFGLVAGWLAVSMLATTFATSANASDEDFADAIAAFHDVCLKSEPGFADALAIVETLGFAVYPAAEDEFEFGSEDGVLHGYVSSNPDYPGCTVMAEALGQARAADLAAELLIDTFGVTLDPWDYDDQQAGWRMPRDEGVLYIIFNEGGLSAEMRNE